VSPLYSVFSNYYNIRLTLVFSTLLGVLGKPLLLCLLISIFPKSTFAVGKGIKKVKGWKLYYKILYYIIPFVIIIPLAIGVLSNIIAQRIF